MVGGKRVAGWVMEWQRVLQSVGSVGRAVHVFNTDTHTERGAPASCSPPPPLHHSDAQYLLCASLGNVLCDPPVYTGCVSNKS